MRAAVTRLVPNRNLPCVDLALQMLKRCYIYTEMPAAATPWKLSEALLLLRKCNLIHETDKMSIELGC